MTDRDDGWLPADEKLTPERAVRLLRAKNAELEATVLHTATNPGLLDTVPHLWKLHADVALLFAILADHIEDLIDKGNLPVDLPLATQQRLDTDDANVHEYTESQRLHANEHIINLTPGKWIIQHPLSERLDGSLLDCSVEWSEEDLGVYGRFVLVWDDEADEWVLGDRL